MGRVKWIVMDERFDQYLVDELYGWVRRFRDYSWHSLLLAVYRLRRKQAIDETDTYYLELAISRLRRIEVKFPLSVYELWRLLNNYAY